MSKTIELLIRPRTGGSSWKFPHRCVYCGKNPETQLAIKVVGSGTFRQSHRMNVTTSYSNTFLIPYCHQHASLSKQYNSAINAAIIVGSLIIGILFVILTYNESITEVSTGETASPLLVAAISALVFGGMGGWLTFYLAKYPLSLYYKSIKDQFGWNQYHGALGINISPKIEAHSGTVTFEFTNDDVAQEFMQMNIGDKINDDVAQESSRPKNESKSDIEREDVRKTHQEYPQVRIPHRSLQSDQSFGSLDQPQAEKHPWLMAMTIFSISGSILILFFGVSLLTSLPIGLGLLLLGISSILGIGYALITTEYFRKWNDLTKIKQRLLYLAIFLGLTGYVAFLGNALVRVLKGSSETIAVILLCAFPIPVVVWLLLRSFAMRSRK